MIKQLTELAGPSCDAWVCYPNPNSLNYRRCYNQANIYYYFEDNDKYDKSFSKYVAVCGKHVKPDYDASVAICSREDYLKSKDKQWT